MRTHAPLRVTCTSTFRRKRSGDDMTRDDMEMLQRDAQRMADALSGHVPCVCETRKGDRMNAKDYERLGRWVASVDPDMVERWMEDSEG